MSRVVIVGSGTGGKRRPPGFLSFRGEVCGCDFSGCRINFWMRSSGASPTKIVFSDGRQFVNPAELFHLPAGAAENAQHLPSSDIFIHSARESIRSV